MAKARKSAFPAPPQSSTPAVSDDGERNEFLKADHVGKKVGDHATLTIVAGSARTGPSNFGSGEQVIVAVKHKGKTFDFGLDPTKPNYRLLYESKGDPATWKGSFGVKVMAGRSNWLAVERGK